MPFDTRRTFLAQMTGLASLGGVAAGTRTVSAQRAGRSEPAAARTEKWDTAWLDGFKGKHKQLYDLMWHTLRPNTLNPPSFYLDVHRDVSGLEFPDVNVVIGVNTSWALNASDALWEKYNVAEVGGPPAGGLYDGEGNVHPFGSVPGFGWSNGVFVDFEQRLRPSDTL